MSEVSSVRLWGTIIAGFVLTLAVLIAAAYLWVWIYSVAIFTGGDAAHYEAYAQVASPVVAVVLSFPVFYVMGRFMKRFGEKAMFAAMGVVGINLVMDVLAVSTMAEDMTFNVTMSVLSAAGKIAGAYFGARPAGMVSAGAG